MTIRRIKVRTYTLPNNIGESRVLVRVKRCITLEVQP